MHSLVVIHMDMLRISAVRNGRAFRLCHSEHAYRNGKAFFLCHSEHARTRRALCSPTEGGERGPSGNLLPSDTSWNPLKMNWKPISESESDSEIATILRLSNMINSFRHRGHFAANLDPLRGSSHKKLNPHEPIYWVNTDAVDTCRLLKDYPAKVDLSVFGLENVDLNRRFNLSSEFLAHTKTHWTVMEVVEFMRESYCGSIGVEYTHLSDRFQRSWIKTIFERGAVEWQAAPSEMMEEEGTSAGGVGGGGAGGGGAGGGRRGGGRMEELRGGQSEEERREALELLMRADHLEHFLGSKFPAVKRFGIEGAEAVLPGLHAMITAAARMGVDGVELGMAHRGRLNVLVNLFGKPLGALVNEFTESDVSVADVKYHLGTYAKRQFADKQVYMNLAANPSHLEAVNAVVVGKARAKQYLIGSQEQPGHGRVLPILLHGDAAFSGQGIVAEVMQLADIPSYTTGGTIHIIINNMIGFTTDPRASRTSYHCTNVGKGVEAPILHVNGDDLPAVMFACKVAGQWRQTFARDVVVDIVCYRRHGHNELDEPSLTQPLTYAEIAKHRTLLQIYTQELMEEGVVTTQEDGVVSREHTLSNEEEPSMSNHKQQGAVRELSHKIFTEFEHLFKTAKSYEPSPSEWLAKNWQGHAISELVRERPYNLTGTSIETLLQIGKAVTTIPADFTAHPKVTELFARRRHQLERGKVDMSMAELLAVGALMVPLTPTASFGRIRRQPEDASPSFKDRSLADTIDELQPHALTEYVAHPTVDVRLSGQDSERGTFNQRHAVIYDQTTARPYTPLNNMGLGPQAHLQICNSSLSEAAVLGFEYGYSLESDLALVIWEAQFGDFANVAQHIIDNLIVSGESKWGQSSALVLLLPHGYDGQGPEHSSARLERFLQLVDDDPDLIPGTGTAYEAELRRGWDLLPHDHDDMVSTNDLIQHIVRVSNSSTADSEGKEVSEIMHKEERRQGHMLTELANSGTSHTHTQPHTSSLSPESAGDSKRPAHPADPHPPNPDPLPGAKMTREEYFMFAAGWMRRNAERTHNISVVNCSTPAQYFHVLRRQIHRPFAKPLIVMSPKYLLHHRACQSDLKDMAPNTFFRRVIVELGPGDNMASRNYPLASRENIRKVVLCSGQIFYELYHARAARKITDVTLVRVEQIAPFPFDRIAAVLRMYPNAQWCWAQQEPKNMGAWSYIQPRFRTLIKTLCRDLIERELVYVGRSVAPSPATGLFRIHREEQEQIFCRIFNNT